MSRSHVLTSVEDGVGRIVLHRPNSLNALTLDMIRVISAALEAWKTNNDVRCVIFSGAGPRAFCAGGDVKQFYRAGMDFRRGDTDIEPALLFFKEEYALNALISSYPKTTISYMDGIVMGGGYGIGGHCDFRVVTDQTVFAMPEVKIGFFPDVGSVYHLLKAPKSYGTYLALTGESIGAADMVRNHLADFYTHMPAKDVDLILRDSDFTPENIRVILETVSHDTQDDGILQDQDDFIHTVFEGFRLPKIMKVLSDTDTLFAYNTRKALLAANPSSVLVTAEHLRLSVGLSLQEVLAQDLILAKHFLQRSDMYEGIEARIIAKDRAPVWSAGGMKEMTLEDVSAYFQS